MGMFRKVRKIAKPVLLALPPLLCASLASATATWDFDVPAQAPTLSSGGWKIAQKTDDGTIRITTTGESGTLHVFCSTDNCNVFVEPASGCVPGTVYPLLVNSADKVGVMPARCVLVKQEGEPKLVAHIGQSTELMHAIVAASDISIAFPTQAGKMDVLDIRTQGAARLLADSLGAASAPANQRTRPEATIKSVVRASTTRYQI